MTHIDTFRKAIEKWGVIAQFEMAQEEATELALAVRKYIRNIIKTQGNPDADKFNALAEEIADVEIMIEQMKMIEPMLQKAVDNQKSNKIIRLQSRLDKGLFEDEKENE